MNSAPEFDAAVLLAMRDREQGRLSHNQLNALLDWSDLHPFYEGDGKQNLMILLPALHYWEIQPDPPEMVGKLIREWIMGLEENVLTSVIILADAVRETKHFARSPGYMSVWEKLARTKAVKPRCGYYVDSEPVPRPPGKKKPEPAILPPEPEETDVPADEVTRGAASPEPAILPPESERTIVFVPTDEATHDASARELRDQGFRVIEADVWEALAALPDADMVIVDVDAPWLASSGLIRRTREEHPAVKVLLISTDADARLLCRDRQNDILLKPYEEYEITEKAAELMEIGDEY